MALPQLERLPLACSKSTVEASPPRTIRSFVKSTGTSSSDSTKKAATASTTAVLGVYDATVSALRVLSDAEAEGVVVVMTKRYTS